MRQIITLVGASVLLNGKRELKVENPDALQLLAYLRSTDETRGSAETNSLQYLLKEDDGIIFVHSDTPEGHLCAEVLDQFYSYGRYGLTKDEPNQPKGTLAFAKKLARIEYVEEVRGVEFLDTAMTRIQQEFKDGDLYKIRVIYSDGNKGVYLTLTTTAQTMEQNSLVRRKVEELIKGLA